MKGLPRPSIFWTRSLISNHRWVSRKTMKGTVQRRPVYIVRGHEFKSRHYQFLQLLPYKHTWALDVHFLFLDSKELIHKMHINNPEPLGGSKGRAEMCHWKAPCEQVPPTIASPACRCPQRCSPGRTNLTNCRPTPCPPPEAQAHTLLAGKVQGAHTGMRRKQGGHNLYSIRAPPP